MPVEEPSWWYATQPTWQARTLAPVSALYALAATRRLGRGATYRSRLPVICIGNFTAGGTGKTPLALLVAELLRELGRRPAFLTRGYGGETRAPRLVETSDTAARVGDEPLLLARAAPTVVARDRPAGARAIEALGAAAADVIVMDDGLQNPALAKDLVLAVVDGRRGVGNGRVIPAGPLRAPLGVQLAHADALIVTQAQAAAGQGATGVLAALRSTFQGPVLSAETRPVPPLDWLKDGPFVAYCGIGAPRRFLDLLRSLGTSLAAEVTFNDHHAFSEADADGLLALAEQHGANLVTTEKDLVRLTGASGARATLLARSRALTIATSLSSSERERLQSLIASALAAHRGDARSGAKAGLSGADSSGATPGNAPVTPRR